MRGFLIHLIVYIVVIAALAALNVSRNPTHLWVIWVSIGWGLGIILHGLLAYRAEKAQQRRAAARQKAGTSQNTGTNQNSGTSQT
jgi:hypothetical protein